MPGPLIVSLLPARNAAGDLTGHLESVAPLADAVVALDDGSTDGTRAILEAHPLVRTVLTNPRRETYAGWDDAANRNRLLDAALALGAQWVVQLDADERLAPDDAEALRDFLHHDADPACAYLLHVYRMVDGLETFDDDPVLIARVFAPRPGHRFPDAALHFVALPTAIPRERWVETTIRVQHFGSSTSERRRARFAKYREADPDRTWQASYDHLLDAPRAVRRWMPRPPHLPVVAHAPVPDPRPLAPDEPALSVVIVSVDDEAIIERAVRAVVTQECDEPFEVIVVTSGTDRTAAIVRERFPAVRVVALDHPALPGEARNVGWRLARGRYVTFAGSHVELLPGCFAARLAAHRSGWPLVTEAMWNGTRTRSGWAAYFLEQTLTLPGGPGRAFTAPPPRCSYPRALLEVVGGFPEDMRAGEDTVVNEALFRAGYGAYFTSVGVSIHHTPCRTPGVLWGHFVKRGRGLGRILGDEVAAGRLDRRGLRRRVLRLVPDRLRGIHRRVRPAGRVLRTLYWMSLPLVGLGSVAVLVGCVEELVRPGRVAKPG